MSKQIDVILGKLQDWRGETFAAARAAILSADPGIVEEVKWMGSPVWCMHGGNMVVGDAHKDKVKLTFRRGSSLKDPKKLFNNGFGGGSWRAIDFAQGDKVQAAALRDLVKEAIQAELEAKTSKVQKKGAGAQRAMVRKKKALAKKAEG
jgi:hypothetical protein